MKGRVIAILNLKMVLQFPFGEPYSEPSPPWKGAWQPA